MRFRTIPLILLLMSLSFAVFAQTAATTTVSGTVTDANGAVVAKATV